MQRYSSKQKQQRPDGHGQDIAQIDALLISHNHREHASSMGVLQRKFGLPIHVTRPALAAARASMPLGDLSEIHHFTAGSSLDSRSVQVETISTPHDGVDGVALRPQPSGHPDRSGYGLFVGEGLLSHPGYIVGFRSHSIVDIEKNLLVVVFSNKTTNNPRRIARGLLKEIES